MAERTTEKEGLGGRPVETLYNNGTLIEVNNRNFTFIENTEMESVTPPPQPLNELFFEDKIGNQGISNDDLELQHTVIVHTLENLTFSSHISSKNKKLNSSFTSFVRGRNLQSVDLKSDTNPSLHTIDSTFNSTSSAIITETHGIPFIERYQRHNSIHDYYENGDNGNNNNNNNNNNEGLIPVTRKQQLRQRRKQEKKDRALQKRERRLQEEKEYQEAMLDYAANVDEGSGSFELEDDNPFSTFLSTSNTISALASLSLSENSDSHEQEINYCTDDDDNDNDDDEKSSWSRLRFNIESCSNGNNNISNGDDSLLNAPMSKSARRKTAKKARKSEKKKRNELLVENEKFSLNMTNSFQKTCVTPAFRYLLLRLDEQIRDFVLSGKESTIIPRAAGIIANKFTLGLLAQYNIAFSKLGRRKVFIIRRTKSTFIPSSDSSSSVNIVDAVIAKIEPELPKWVIKSQKRKEKKLRSKKEISKPSGVKKVKTGPRNNVGIFKPAIGSVVGEHAEKLSEGSKGYDMLVKMGWAGKSLGVNEERHQEEVKVVFRSKRQGLGAE